MRALFHGFGGVQGSCSKHNRAFARCAVEESEVLKLSRRLVFGVPLLALTVGTTQAPSATQAFPDKIIRIVVSATAGTPPDIVSRIVANELSRVEGWQTVVENRPGAMQTMAASEVLKQPADGLTIMTVSLPSTVAPSLLPAVNFRLDTEFVPVIRLMTANHVLVVNPSVPAQSLVDLVALLKSQPDKLQFSSGGFGTPAHLAGEAFKLQTGVRAAHVPYSALPQAIGDLLNGTNHYQFITPLPVLDLIATGKLRALAVTAPNRMPALKDVPTVGEAGFPDLIIQDWVGLVVKAGTPGETVAILNAAINKALAQQSVRDALAKMAAEPGGGTPAEFGNHVKSQTIYWSNVAKETGLRMHK